MLQGLEKEGCCMGLEWTTRVARAHETRERHSSDGSVAGEPRLPLLNWKSLMEHLPGNSLECFMFLQNSHFEMEIQSFIQVPWENFKYIFV